MYKGHSVLDEELSRQEKYASLAKETNTDYHAGGYNSGSGSDMYNSNKAGDDKKKEKEAAGLDKSVDDHIKKYTKKDEASAEDIKKKAASEIAEGIKVAEKQKEFKSIEDAINKAVKETKEIIIVK